MSSKLCGVEHHGWRKGGLNQLATSKLFPLPLDFSSPPPQTLMSHAQVAVVHLSKRHGKWLRPTLPAMLVYRDDLQADRKDDRTELFGADP